MIERRSDEERMVDNIHVAIRYMRCSDADVMTCWGCNSCENIVSRIESWNEKEI